MTMPRRIAKEFLHGNDVTVLDWPAVSPDMNCIENLWAVLSRALSQHKPQPQDPDELFAILSDEWNKIPEDIVLSHTASMRRRVVGLWRQEGGYTKY